MFPSSELMKAMRKAFSRYSAALLLSIAACGGHAMAQAQEQSATSDQQMIKALVARIDQLEARVRQLENSQQQSSMVSESTQTAVAPAPSHHQAGPAAPVSETAPSSSPQEHEAEPTEHAETERMDLSKTLLRVRGFGDVTFLSSNFHPPIGEAPMPSSFALGQLNLFVTSDISDRFKFLSEIVFEAGPDNIYGVPAGTANTFNVDIERYLLQYSRNDYFNLSVGRYHTAIGYYNTAYHHSTWLQTATGRPLLFSFEDRGGILPIHNVGIEASGRIPSGWLGLHYIAELGNGRESRIPLEQEPVQNSISDKNHKAFNVAVFSRPTNIAGLQVGFSAYHDLLVPLGQPNVSETILAGHAVYSTPNFEWLNEALVVRHVPAAFSHVFDTPGFYSQISRRFGAYRPYFRYQYVNASSQEPIFPDVGLRAGPQVGLRYDASESVALKLQYDYTSLRNQQATQGVEAQVGFTF